MEPQKYPQLIQPQNIAKTIQKHLDNLKKKLLERRKICFWDIVMFIDSEHWQLVYFDDDIQLQPSQKNLIEFINKYINKNVKVIIPDKNDNHVRLVQFSEYLQKINLFQKYPLFRLLNTIFINKTVVKQILTILKEFNSLKDFNGPVIVQGYISKIYQNQEMSKILIELTDSEVGQGNPFRSFIFNVFKKSLDVPLFDLSQNQYIRTYLMVSNDKKIPQGFIDRLTKYLSINLEGYTSLMNLILEHLSKSKIDNFKVNLEIAFCDIYEKLSKEPKFKIQSNQFTSIIFTNAWISISKLSSYEKLMDKIQNTILNLLQSENEVDKTLVHSLYDSFKSNKSSFNEKNQDKLRMNAKFGNMFKISFSQISSNRIKDLLLTFLKREQSLSSSFFSKNIKQVQRYSINCKNKQVKEVYQDVIKQLQINNFKIQDILTMNSNAQIEKQQRNLTNHSAEINKIYEQTSVCLKNKDKLSTFLQSFKQIHVFLKQQPQLNSDKILQNRIQDNLDKIVSIMKLIENKETFLSQIYQKLKDNEFEQSEKNFQFIKCFYRTELFHENLMKTKGAMLTKTQQLISNFKLSIMIQLQKNQLTLLQTKNAFQKASLPQLKQLLLHGPLAKYTNLKSANLLIKFVELDLPIFQLSKLLQTAIQIKTSVFHQSFNVELKLKLQEFTAKYDQLIVFGCDNRFKLSKVSLLCKIYVQIANVLQIINNSFMLQNLSCFSFYQKRFEEFKKFFNLSLLEQNSLTTKLNQSIVSKSKEIKENQKLKHTVDQLKNFLKLLKKIQQIKYSPKPYERFVKEKQISQQDFQCYQKEKQLIDEFIRLSELESTQIQKLKLSQIMSWDFELQQSDDQSYEMKQKNSHYSVILEYEVKQKKSKSQQISQIISPYQNRDQGHYKNNKFRVKGDENIKKQLSKIIQPQQIQLIPTFDILPDHKSDQNDLAPINQQNQQQKPKANDNDNEMITKWLKKVIICSKECQKQGDNTTEHQHPELKQSEKDKQPQLSVLENSQIIEQFHRFLRDNYQDQGQFEDENKKPNEQYKQKLLQYYPALFQPSNKQQTFVLFLYIVTQMISYKLVGYQNSSESQIKDLSLRVKLIFEQNQTLLQLFEEYQNNPVQQLIRDHIVGEVLVFNNPIYRPKVYLKDEVDQFIIVEFDTIKNWFNN